MEPLTPLFTGQISQSKFSFKEKGTHSWWPECQGPSPYRQSRLGRVCPGGWWSWVLAPRLNLKNKGNGSFAKPWGCPALMGSLWQRSRGAPTALLPLHLSWFSCVQGTTWWQLLPFPQTAAHDWHLPPPSSWPLPAMAALRGRGGLCLQTLSDLPAALLLFNTRHSLGREGGAVSWAATLGVGLGGLWTGLISIALMLGGPNSQGAWLRA